MSANDRLGNVVTVSESGDARVSVVGEVDGSNAADFCLEILGLARKWDRTLEVDLAGVTFMDSTGLRALDDAARALSASGFRLVLSNPPRHVRQIIDIIGVGASLQVRA